MRDIIYAELMRVYARDGLGMDFEFVADTNNMLANQIEGYLVYRQTSLDDPEVEHEVKNMIWMNWPGGATAGVVASRIMKALQDAH